MFFSKKTIEQRLRETEAKRGNAPCVKDMQEITEQYLGDINGGGGWPKSHHNYKEWGRSYDLNSLEPCP